MNSIDVLLNKVIFSQLNYKKLLFLSLVLVA